MEWELAMRALIERQLYQPAVVLPLLVLMRLMVTLDFNLAQVTLVVVAKGSQYVFKAVFKPRAGRGESRAVCHHCHC
jgi:type IV secretory pathway VirB3-like protein